MKNWRVATALGIGAIGIFLFLIAKPSNALPVITWNPSSFAPEVIAGETTSTTISFTSSQKLIAAQVRVSPELEGVVSVTPSNLGSVPPGQTISLTITLSPAATVTPSQIGGTLSIHRSILNDVVYGAPLSVDIEVNWPSLSDPDGSYTLDYPPLLTAHFDATYGDLLLLPPPEVGDTEVPGIIVSKEANPENLSIRDFFDGTHAPNLFSQSLDIFSTSTLPNGAAAYFFDPVTTLGGGVVVVVQRSQGFLVVQDNGGGHRSDIDIILNSLAF